MFDAALTPDEAADLLHSPRQLQRLILGSQRSGAGGAMLDTAAHMLLLAEDFDRMLDPMLAYFCRTLGADRCDAGLGAPQHAWFVSTAQQTLPGADVLDVVGLPIPNTHLVTQASWGATQPLCFDLDLDTRCADLKRIPALAQSRRIMVRRLAYNGQALGQVCADQVLTRRTWGQSEQQLFETMIGTFAAPLAFLHTRARLAGSNRPTAAQLQVIRQIAQGLTYKQAARVLNKSVRTVSNQLTQARQRMQAHNEVELVRKCRRWLE